MVKFGGKKARKHLKFIYLYKIFVVGGRTFRFTRLRVCYGSRSCK